MAVSQATRDGNGGMISTRPAPVSSSAGSRWEGIVLERHAHGAFSAPDYEYPTHYLCLHLGPPALFAWRSQGKAGRAITGPGAVAVLSRGTQAAVSFPEPVQRLVLKMEWWIFERALQEQRTGQTVELINQWGVRDPQIEYILRALDAEMNAGFPSDPLFVESLITALAVHLQARYGVSRSAARKPRAGLTRKRLHRVMEHIAAHVDSGIRLSDLAETAGVSPHYFAELFKESTGVSPHQYVLRHRVGRARELLRDPRVTVLEAAIRTGFVDQSHFSKMFRRIVGVLPSEYRARS
jgi:AraC family transcriptional regulator